MASHTHIRPDTIHAHIQTINFICNTSSHRTQSIHDAQTITTPNSVIIIEITACKSAINNIIQ